MNEDDDNLDETKRIMRNLARMPHKPHESLNGKPKPDQGKAGAKGRPARPRDRQE
jgi:hypothetical protein